MSDLSVSGQMGSPQGPSDVFAQRRRELDEEIDSLAKKTTLLGVNEGK